MARLNPSFKVLPLKNQMILRLDVVPAGGGNRRITEQLKAIFSSNEHLSPHIRKIVVRTSRCDIYFECSLASARAFADWGEQCRQKLAEAEAGQGQFNFAVA